MADLRIQRRLAASILKCGENRIWMDPDRLEEIAKASIRRDVKILINGGAIKKKPVKGISSGRTNYKKSQKEKGRRRGQGSRKGSRYARLPRKERWIRTIRPLREYLRQLRDDKIITSQVYRRYYMRAKGGEFRSKQHLKSHLIADGLIEEKVKQ
ncbi:MAG: 50S ribosomal protein L19e [Candidatus Thermoplasmatota archaeon]